MNNVCPLCEGKKTKGDTTFTADLGYGVVVVRNVPAKVCSQCGEEWIEANVARNIEEIVKGAKSKHSLVEILAYQ